MQSNFPNLNYTNYRKTSEETSEYNCIAWAAEEEDRFWWPLPIGFAYWPKGVSRSELVDSFLDAFRTLGYEICASGELEAGYQKVAIYVNNNGVPTHMARQLPDGSWTSKLGRNIDINHKTLETLHGPAYGKVSTFMSRLLKH